MTDVDNWEEHGAVTPEEAAEYFDEWVYNLLDQGCPMPVARLEARADANVSIAHNTEKQNVWSSASRTADMFDINLTTGVVTVLKDARIQLSVLWNWQNVAGGDREIRVRIAGAWVWLDRAASAGNFAQSNSLSMHTDVLANDTIVVGAYQNSGTAVNLIVASAIKPRLTILAWER